MNRTAVLQKQRSAKLQEVILSAQTKWARDSHLSISQAAAVSDGTGGGGGARWSVGFIDSLPASLRGRSRWASVRRLCPSAVVLIDCLVERRPLVTQHKTENKRNS